MREAVIQVLNQIDDVMYYPILIIVMAIAGCYFTILTKGVQIRLFRVSCRLVMEPSENGRVSSFQALMVSTASRVGTGNIIGAVLALLVGYCLIGGGKRIIRLTSLIVPFMGLSYVVISLIVICVNIIHVPAMFAEIFRDAFNFKAIFSGVGGSCLIYGIKQKYPAPCMSSKPSQRYLA